MLCKNLLLLPPLGEGWDGGTHINNSYSALAPTLTLPWKGRELKFSSPGRGGKELNPLENARSALPHTHAHRHHAVFELVTL